MKLNKINNQCVSLLGMGNMRLPETNGKIDYEKSSAIIDYCMASGINYFDTAYMYHNNTSEDFVGEALKKYDRNSYVLATKYNVSANPNYEETFSQQLTKLKTDYIDFYLIHAVSDGTLNDYLTNGCIQYFEKQKQLGRVKHLGFSFHGSIDCLNKFIVAHNWDFVQLQINYLDWHFGSAKQEYDIAINHNLPIIVMEPIRGGRLANLTKSELEIISNTDTPASFALRFVKDLKNVCVVLSGMGNTEQVKQNISSIMAEPLTDAEQNNLKSVAQSIKQASPAPCTKCNYCMPKCPKELNIPGILENYNKLLSWRFDKPNLNDLPQNLMASNCIGCKACNAVCPQKIDIAKAMNDFSDKC